MTEAPDVSDQILYDGQVADQAAATLKQLASNNDKPFFLAVGFIKPHTPFVAPKKYWDLYDFEQIELANTSTTANAPQLALHGSGEIRRYTDQPQRGPIPKSNQRQMKHGYAACISYVDAQVGKVLDALKEAGLHEDTIVVLWSDHGYHLGEKELWGKTTNFELDTRVALTIRAPGQRAPGSTDALVELVDLYPTLIELTGLPAPKHRLQGTSFAPLLSNPDRPWKQAAFSQYTRSGHRGYSLTDGRFRYTEWININSGSMVERELYDHQSDAAEMRNLAATPELAATAQRLSKLLRRGEGWRSTKPPTLQLGKPFGDHMVLQREKPAPIFGTAIPNSNITVTFGKQTSTTTANGYGKWIVELEAMPANSIGRNLIVKSGGVTIEVNDVLVGEVWLCAGQSNMRWSLKQSSEGAEAIAHAKNPLIRLLDFTGSLYPSNSRYPLLQLRSIGADNYYHTGGWQRCSSESAADFSAVAYHFGSLLQQELNVPIGLIHNAVGGVPMETYIPTNSPGNWLIDEDIPNWCRERGSENLSSWIENRAFPTPHHPFESGFLYEAGIRPASTGSHPRVSLVSG